MVRLLAAGMRVWLRADSAYYCGELADCCWARGWERTISVPEVLR